MVLLMHLNFAKQQQDSVGKHSIICKAFACTETAAFRDHCGIAEAAWGGYRGTATDCMIYFGSRLKLHVGGCWDILTGMPAARP